MAKTKTTGAYRFRVSDAVAVPLRGVMLRLKRVAGNPAVGALAPGSTLRLQAPDGETRTVEVKALSLTGGRPTQDRLDRYGQADVVISPEEARMNGRSVEIGWFVVGE